MTVAELIELLKVQEPQAQVILSKDSEGNGFSPLDEFTVGHYEPSTSYSGEFDDSDEALETSPDAICFWPKN